MRKFGNILVVMITLSLILVVGELSMRVSQYVKYNRPLFFSDKCTGLPVYREAKLGWKATEEYFFQGTGYDAAGRAHELHITTNNNGFRFWGHPGEKKVKILIVGDSSTHAMQVSDNKTYYNILWEKLEGAELFVYGCNGYGTLQEYLIIDEFIDVVKPDIIIIQYCNNDFVNNSYELEHKSFKNNNYTRRPYLNEDGQIFYKNPIYYGRFIPSSFLENSRLVIFCVDKF